MTIWSRGRGEGYYVLALQRQSKHSAAGNGVKGLQRQARDSNSS
jgi:hypothetical protein